MKELEMVLNALASMGDKAVFGFILWCIKEVVIHAMIPASIGIVGYTIFKSIKHGYNRAREIAELQDSKWKSRVSIRKIDEIQQLRKEKIEQDEKKS